MEFTNFCKRYNGEMIKAIWGYAKRLSATECTIHKNGTVTLYCKGDCICERYLPTAKELRYGA